MTLRALASGSHGNNMLPVVCIAGFCLKIRAGLYLKPLSRVHMCMLYNVLNVLFGTVGGHLPRPARAAEGLRELPSFVGLGDLVRDLWLLTRPVAPPCCPRQQMRSRDPSALTEAMVLLTIFVSTASLLIGNLLQDYIVSDASEADRQWIWQYYGTSHHSFQTIYEITFAGGFDGICA